MLTFPYSWLNLTALKKLSAKAGVKLVPLFQVFEEAAEGY